MSLAGVTFTSIIFIKNRVSIVSLGRDLSGGERASSGCDKDRLTPTGRKISKKRVALSEGAGSGSSSNIDDDFQLPFETFGVHIVSR